MTKKKSAKRAFISSFMSFIMCFAMLAGTTFAWYTDSVTSSGNKIIAGTLDIELWKYDGSQYVDISASSAPIFKSSNIAQNSTETLWEPGKTQVAYLKLVNNGNLALKYQVALNVFNVTKNLNEAMLYQIVPDARPEEGYSVDSWNPTDANPATTAQLGVQPVSDSVPMAVGATHYFALVIHMDENAGNEYMAGEIDFDLTVLATQDTVEYDSFNNQYDANATMPAAASATVPAGGAASSIEAGGITVDLPANNGDTANVYKLDVSNANTETDNSTGVTSVEFDATLYLNNIKIENSDTIYTMTLNIGPGAIIGVVKHNSSELTEGTGDQQYQYDVTTGDLTIYTKSFSPFSVDYKVAAASVDGTLYETFNAAWSDAKNKTLTLLKDTTLNALQISGEYTIDLGGKTLVLRGHSDAGSTGGAIYIDGGANWTHGNLTIKNGTLSMPGTNFATYGIYNYGTLTLDNVTVNSACDTVIYANGQQWGTAGALTIKDSEINSTKASSTAVAAYAYKGYWDNSPIAPTVNIKDSEINGVYNAVMIYACEANVEGCTITAEQNNALWIMRASMASGVTNEMYVAGRTTINAGSDYKRIYAQDGNSISIGQGTYNFNPTEYVDQTNCDIADNGDGTYTVNVTSIGPGGGDSITGGEIEF